MQRSTKEKRASLDRLGGDMYNNGSRLFVLRRLDAESSETNTTPDLKIITVEHVLPQNPDTGSKWLKWYPDDEDRMTWVHRLGNLALLSRRKNAQAQNFEFDRKKTLYFNSPLTPFALTIQIIKQTSWTKDVLEKRQKEALATLKSLWRL